MNKQDSINRNRNFPSTRWSLIARAQGDDPAERQQAKEDLITSYLPVLRAYLVLKKRISPTQADDFVQEFALKKLVASNLIDQAAESKGKFRNFLLVCLNNTIRDHFRVKRNQEIAMEEEVFENALPGTDEFDLFDGIFARNVFTTSLEQMKLECEEENNPVQWQVFCHRILVPLATTEQALSYESLVEQTGLANAKAVQNCLVNAKRRFKKCLLENVQGYVGDEAQVDFEIHQLCNALARSGNLDVPELNRLLPQQSTDAVVQKAYGANSIAFESVIQACDSDELAWADHDLGLMWKELLNSAVKEWTGEQNGDRTLADCLEDGKLADLRKIKKQSRNHFRETQLPIYFALYCTTIASALNHSLPQISELSHDELQSAFESVLKHNWLDESSRTSLQNAIEMPTA